MELISNTPAGTFFKKNMQILAEAFTSQGIYHTLTFSAALVASNVINGNVGTNAIAAVTYATSSDATMVAIADAIAAMPGIASATVVSGGALATDDRVIEVTPIDQVNGVSLSGFVVTLGASQATVTVATVDRRIRKGMPVELDSVNEGEIKPATTATMDLTSIGISAHDAEAGEEVAVICRGNAILVCKASGGALVPGPVRYVSYDYTNGRIYVDQTSVTAANCYGWAIESAAQDADIKVLVKY